MTGYSVKQQDTARGRIQVSIEKVPTKPATERMRYQRIARMLTVKAEKPVSQNTGKELNNAKEQSLSPTNDKNQLSQLSGRQQPTLDGGM